MSGTTIIGVKIVGLCSKCRKPEDEILKDIHGRVYEDKEISCVGCAIKRTEKEILKQKIEDALNEGYTDGYNDGKRELQERNAEVKQAVKDLIAEEEHRIYGSSIIEVLTKLLERLGLDAKDEEGVSE